MSVLNTTVPSQSGQAIDVSSADWVAPAGSSMRCLLVGVAGDVVGRQIHDTVDIAYPVQAGYNPLSFSVIRTTATTATSLVALF